MRVLLIVITVFAWACTRTSEKYCGLHPQDRANCPPMDAPIEDRVRCSGDPDCAAYPMTTKCLLTGATEGVCVECLVDAECTRPNMMSCDQETHTCRGCIEHADCSSNACLPNGTCGNDDSILYVAPNGVDTGTCKAANPCRTIDYAIDETTLDRYHIKLTGQLTETLTIMAGNYVVLLADPNTKLTGGDPVIKNQGSTLTIYDLEITGTAGIVSEGTNTTTLHNVFIHDCAKYGVEAKTGYIIISRSRFTKNLDGAIWIASPVVQYAVTNSYIFGNGDPAAAKGAVAIDVPTTGVGNRFEHNTIVDNQAKTSIADGGGVTCNPLNGTEMVANIIVGNKANGNADAVGCRVGSSLTNMDKVMFNFTAEYRLMAGSIAIDGVMQSSLAEDFDGEFRPQGIRKDYGADEFKP